MREGTEPRQTVARTRSTRRSCASRLRSVTRGGRQGLALDRRETVKNDPDASGARYDEAWIPQEPCSTTCSRLRPPSEPPRSSSRSRYSCERGGTSDRTSGNRPGRQTASTRTLPTDSNWSLQRRSFRTSSRCSLGVLNGAVAWRIGSRRGQEQTSRASLDPVCRRPGRSQPGPVFPIRSAERRPPEATAGSEPPPPGCLPRTKPGVSFPAFDGRARSRHFNVKSAGR